MLTGLIEIIIYVEDMDSQVRFYRDILGLRLSYPLETLDFTSEHWVTFDTGGCILALHSGGKGNRGDDAPKFVFGVSDIVSTRNTLKNKGIQVGEIRIPAPSVKVCDCIDPEGTAFSIEEK